MKRSEITAQIRSNSEIIDETYYEYHGKYDDGTTPADESSATIPYGFSEVCVA